MDIVVLDRLQNSSDRLSGSQTPVSGMEDFSALLE
jgi:hypothetical protein